MRPRASPSPSPSDLSLFILLLTSITHVTSQGANANIPSQVVTNSSSDGLTTAQIVGAAVGSAGAVAICLIICLCYRYYRTEDDHILPKHQLDTQLQHQWNDARLTKMDSMKIYEQIEEETDSFRVGMEHANQPHPNSHPPPTSASTCPPILSPSPHAHVRQMSIPSTIHSVGASQVHDEDDKLHHPIHEAAVLTRQVGSDDMV